MKATLDVELEPFTVPNFVRIRHPDPKAEDIITVPIGTVDSLTLDRMCNEFRDSVFKKAGRTPPPTCAPTRS